MHCNKMWCWITLPYGYFTYHATCSLSRIFTNFKPFIKYVSILPLQFHHPLVFWNYTSEKNEVELKIRNQVFWRGLRFNRVRLSNMIQRSSAMWLLVWFCHTKILKNSPGVQWWGIQLPMQGTWVWLLIQEDSTSTTTTEPACCNYGACAPRACAPQEQTLLQMRSLSTTAVE